VVRILPNSIFDFKLSFVLRAEDESIYFEDIPDKISSTDYNWSIPQQSAKFGAVSQAGRFESKNKAGVTAEINVIDVSYPNNTAEVEVVVAEPFVLRHVIADVTDKLESVGVVNLEKDRSLQ
jgi:hypothetical protein